VTRLLQATATQRSSGGHSREYLARHAATKPVLILPTTSLVYFQDKVDTVRASTSATPLYDVPFKPTKSSSDSWTAVTIDEVNKLISASPNKTCQLDPVPTWLVKEMRELLAPLITLLFNRSLVTECFPSEFKHAIVRTLLKKSGLDASDLKNYRPVSNLSFLSKLLERVVQKRLQAILESKELMPSQQSAYRQHHSTETAVLKIYIYNDLLMAADSGLVSALCLLDLTAAFDNVDHDLLLLRLERQFGLHGVIFSGSGLTGSADLIVFGLPAPPQGPCTSSSAWFPRVQSSARDCLSCTLQTWPTRL